MVAVLFSNKLNTNIKLYINNNNINWSHFWPQINMETTYRNYYYQCKTKLNILRCISGNEWGADCKIIFKLYTSLIKPILEYGC